MFKFQVLIKLNKKTSDTHMHTQSMSKILGCQIENISCKIGQRTFGIIVKDKSNNCFILSKLFPQGMLLMVVHFNGDTWQKDMIHQRS